MSAETGLFDDILCAFTDDDENTDEDVLSDDGSDYEENGDDVMIDEVLEFDDDDDVCTFVDRANYYLHTPKSTKSIGMDTEKS